MGIFLLKLKENWEPSSRGNTEQTFTCSIGTPWLSDRSILCPAKMTPSTPTPMTSLWEEKKSPQELKDYMTLNIWQSELRSAKSMSLLFKTTSILSPSGPSLMEAVALVLKESSFCIATWKTSEILPCSQETLRELYHDLFELLSNYKHSWIYTFSFVRDSRIAEVLASLFLSP